MKLKGESRTEREPQQGALPVIVKSVKLKLKGRAAGELAAATGEPAVKP